MSLSIHGCTAASPIVHRLSAGCRPEQTSYLFFLEFSLGFEDGATVAHATAYVRLPTDPPPPHPALSPLVPQTRHARSPYSIQLLTKVLVSLPVRTVCSCMPICLRAFLPLAGCMQDNDGEISSNQLEITGNKGEWVCGRRQVAWSVRYRPPGTESRPFAPTVHGCLCMHTMHSHLIMTAHLSAVSSTGDFKNSLAMVQITQHASSSEL